MKYIYIDPETGWEYTFDFSQYSNYRIAGDGFVLRIRVPTNRGLIVQTMSSIHIDVIEIVDGKSVWQEYHTRKQEPLTSASARDYVERMIRLRAFM